MSNFCKIAPNGSIIQMIRYVNEAPFEDAIEISDEIAERPDEWMFQNGKWVDIGPNSEKLYQIQLEEVRRKRSVEYPPLGEFADAYVKLQSGDSAQMEAYVAACLAVKEKYPKPTLPE